MCECVCVCRVLLPVDQPPCRHNHQASLEDLASSQNANAAKAQKSILQNIGKRIKAFKLGDHNATLVEASFPSLRICLLILGEMGGKCVCRPYNTSIRLTGKERQTRDHKTFTVSH